MFITYQITKTSLIFSKCAMVRELFDIEVVLRNALLKLCFKTVELAFLTSWLPGGFLGEIRWILKIWRRMFSRTYPWTLIYFIFHTGVTDWEIQKNLWALCFQFSWFPVWDMFLWQLFRLVGDEFKEIERGLSS